MTVAADFRVYLDKEEADMSRQKREKTVVVGVKQTLRALEKRQVRELLVAEDADLFVTRSVLDAAALSGVPVRNVDSRKNLGALCGIETSAATAAILKQSDENLQE